MDKKWKKKAEIRRWDQVKRAKNAAIEN